MAKRKATTPATTGAPADTGAPVVTTPAGDPLETVRAEAAEAAIVGYGRSLAYAQKMVDVFGIDFWRKASKSFAKYQAEKTKFTGILKAANHSNPSQEWKRILEKAEKICHPPVAGENGANSTNSLLVRQIDWLKAMYKSARREDKKHGLTDKENEIQLAVMKILRESCNIKPEDIK